jgi:hypothetical protein
MYLDDKIQQVLKSVIELSPDKRIFSNGEKYICPFCDEMIWFPKQDSIRYKDDYIQESIKHKKDCAYILSIEIQNNLKWNLI